MVLFLSLDGYSAMDMQRRKNNNQIYQECNSCLRYRIRTNIRISIEQVLWTDLRHEITYVIAYDGKSKSHLR
jgi:hypothetical protein